MKVLLFPILAGSLLLTSPALAGPKRDTNDLSSAAICELVASGSARGDRMESSAGIPLSAYIAYVAAGGTMTWHQFMSYVLSTCSAG